MNDSQSFVNLIKDKDPITLNHSISINGNLIVMYSYYTFIIIIIISLNNIFFFFHFLLLKNVCKEMKKTKNKN